MVNLGRAFKDYRESGALNALLAPSSFVDDATFLTKSGGLGMVLGVRGIDYECLDAGVLDALTRRFEAALRTFDERYKVYQYLLKRDGARVPRKRAYGSRVVEEAVGNRVDYLESKAGPLYSMEVYFVVLYGAEHPHEKLADLARRVARQPRRILIDSLSNEKTLQILEADLAQRREALRNKIQTFVIQLQDVFAVRVLDKDQAFAFFRRLVNLDPRVADNVRIKHNQHIDYFMADSPLECHPRHLKIGECFVKILTLKVVPGLTFPHLLRGLQEIECNFILCSEWQRESNVAMLKAIHSRRRHFHNSKAALHSYLFNRDGDRPDDALIDDSAVAHVADLGECLKEINNRGNYFGRFTFTVVLYGQDLAAVRRAVAEAFKTFTMYDAVLMEESYNLLNAYLAVIPGNSAFNLRSLWMPNTNYADLSFAFTLHSGETKNSHLRDEYLAVFETNHRTLYYLNLHQGDVAHSVILGATGAGKSFLLNFLITNLQKYQPYTFIFDLGGGYEHLTKLFGGRYACLGASDPGFTINPFSIEPTSTNLQFLFSFVSVLLASSGYRPTAEDDRNLAEALHNVYELDPPQRRLMTLANMLPKSLANRLHKWVGETGQYGHLFDNVEDTLSFARFQTFNFEGMALYPQILEPLLFYILHRANSFIYAPELATVFKSFVFDEAWRFFENEVIRDYIVEALKTWRKHNAAMTIATQSSDDLQKSNILDVILESCPTQIFLANPGMNARSYCETFRLSGREAELVATLIPKQQLLVKTPDKSKVLNLRVDDRSYWLYTNSPHDNARRREVLARHGLQQGLEILAAEGPGATGRAARFAQV